jgi:hypothetical protein
MTKAGLLIRQVETRAQMNSFKNGYKKDRELHQHVYNGRPHQES